jgi:hypothetical protein
MPVGCLWSGAVHAINQSDDSTLQEYLAYRLLNCVLEPSAGSFMRHMNRETTCSDMFGGIER